VPSGGLLIPLIFKASYGTNVHLGSVFNLRSQNWEKVSVYCKGQCEHHNRSLSRVKGYWNEANLNSKEE